MRRITSEIVVISIIISLLFLINCLIPALLPVRDSLGPIRPIPGWLRILILTLYPSVILVDDFYNVPIIHGIIGYLWQVTIGIFTGRGILKMYRKWRVTEGKRPGGR